jgi:hypothetical protein
MASRNTRVKRPEGTKDVLPADVQKSNTGKKAKRDASQATANQHGENSPDKVSQLQVVQLKSLWDLNITMKEISARLGWGMKKIYRIAEAYNFPKRQRIQSPESMDPNGPELTKFRQLWEQGVPRAEIELIMGWRENYVSKAKKRLGLPNRRDNGGVSGSNLQGARHLEPEEAAVIIREEDETSRHIEHIMTGPLDERGRQSLRSFEVSNIRALAEDEFGRQLEQTDALERLAWECIDVMGRTRGEIAAFDDEESLLKKTQLIKGATELIQKSMEHRRKLLRVDDATQGESEGDMFNIDFVAAAKEGGLKFQDPIPKYTDDLDFEADDSY